MTQVDVEPPTKEQLLKTTAIAGGIALAMLFVAVLPAEYGIDPLRTGQLLGLTHEEPATVGAHHIATDPITEYQVAIELPPNSGWVENDLKMWLDEGESFVYQWSSTGPIIADLHEDNLGSYSEHPLTDATEAEGFLTAPAGGYHGWAVRNDGDQPVTFTLRIVGEFDATFDLR